MFPENDVENLAVVVSPSELLCDLACHREDLGERELLPLGFSELFLWQRGLNRSGETS